MNIAAHEAAHVVAKVERRVHRMRAAGCVSGLSQPGDRSGEAEPKIPCGGRRSRCQPSWSGGNQFLAVHTHGDLFDADNEPIVAPSTVTGMLGVSLGMSGYRSRDRSPGRSACNAYQDPRGAPPFTEAMARCKMRKSFFPFCRVCSLMLEDAIADVTP